MKRFLPKSYYGAKGFTLIELMVVIAIIAILSAAGIVLFTNSQKNARDGKRRIDIDAIATALETKKAPNSPTYSAVAGSDFASGNLPSDTGGNVYCMKISTTAGSVGSSISDPATGTNNWVAGTTCPTGWNIFDATDSAGHGADLSSNAANAGGNAVGTAVSWKLCALFENPGSGVTIYCKVNSQ